MHGASSSLTTDRQRAAAIKYIYEDLFSDNLFERYVWANTQNDNVSLISLTGKMCIAAKLLWKIAVLIIMYIFNDGFLPILHIINTMGIQVCSSAMTCCGNRNEDCLHCLAHPMSDDAKEPRIAIPGVNRLMNALLKEDERFYVPGIVG